MLREAARREFMAIITLDGLTEAALHTHCLAPVCVCACVYVCKYDASCHAQKYIYTYIYTHLHTLSG